MDRNMKIVAVAVVVILVAVAAGSILMLDDSKEDKYVSNGSGRVLVYGNVDNDDYLNEKDLDALKSIVSGTWDKTKNPLADVNYDGAVNADDVVALEKILNKEKTKMYYVGDGGKTFYMHYPNTGNIAVSVDYGLMSAQLLHIYDRITACTERVSVYEDERYPGIKDMTVLSNLSRADVTQFVEGFLKTDCTLAMGSLSEKAYEAFTKCGKEVDYIMLSASAQTSDDTNDVIGEMMTLGVLMDKPNEAIEYAKYYDDMRAYFEEQKSKIGDVSFVCAYNTNNPNTTMIDSANTKGGMMGDVWTLTKLPMTEIFPPNPTGGFYEVEMESIMSADPDYIVISIWNVAEDTTSPEDVQKIVDEKAQFFKETNAYKNGKIFAVNYEVFGTCIGISGLGLLGSYIWPEFFDEDEGWNMLQEGIDKFTMLDRDVHECGGLLPYKANTTA